MATYPDVEVVLKAVPAEASILPGPTTAVWTYQAELLRGNPSSLRNLPDTYLGPVLHVWRGQRLRVRFVNQLDQPSIGHWHGMLVPSHVDGHPRDAVKPGQTYTYDFEVLNRAGTCWYHPHPHQLTGPQVYAGLAGLLLVSDEEEVAAGLPAGDYDVPLVIQDRTFDQNNQLVYLQDSGAQEMGPTDVDRMMGFLGDQILVNGHPNFALSVASRPYRLRVLNGSNSRVYKLGWSDETPLTVIGTDGGLLEVPVQRPYVTLGPAERVELWTDFSRRSPGDEITLLSLPFSGTMAGPLGNGMPGIGGMGMRNLVRGSARGSRGSMRGPGIAMSQGLANGAPFSVLKVKVQRQKPESLPLPAKLATFDHYRLADAVNAHSPRVFRLSMTRMAWLLNGRTFEMEDVAEDEIVGLGTLEAWEFVNQAGGTGGMGMSMNHPMHVHGVQFQIIERQVLPDYLDAWRTVSAGYVDEGWKDSVLVMPGERVKFLVRFDRYPGLFLYHCHNLEHEDLGMMRNYRVQA